MTRRPLAKKVCFCGKTALKLLRLWAEENAIPLGRFHRLRPGDVGHLPSRMLKGVTTLRDCARTESELDRVLTLIGSGPIEDAARKLWNEAGSAEPLHMMISDCSGKRSTRYIQYRQAPLHSSARSFLELAPGVLVVSPELLFLHFGTNLTLGGHIALGYELCGGYPIASAPGLVRAPLSSPLLLRSFTKKAQGVNGCVQAQRVLPYIGAKAASPMEAEVSAVATAAVKWGGYGLPLPLLNESVILSLGAARVARSSSLTLDALWPDGSVALEYEGLAAHSGEQHRIRDSRRRDALQVDGIEVLTVTSPQYSSYREFEALLERVRRKLGRRKPRIPSDFLERQGQLREQLRRFHNAW